MLTRPERMDLARDVPTDADVRRIVAEALEPVDEKLDAILRLLLAHTTAAHKEATR